MHFIRLLLPSGSEYSVLLYVTHGTVSLLMSLKYPCSVNQVGVHAVADQCRTYGLLGRGRRVQSCRTLAHVHFCLYTYVCDRICYLNNAFFKFFLMKCCIIFHPGYCAN